MAKAAATAGLPSSIGLWSCCMAMPCGFAIWHDRVVKTSSFGKSRPKKVMIDVEKRT